MELANLAVVLKQNELLVADLYHECARLFPNYSQKFEELAQEEEGHAAIIDSVIDDIVENPQNWRPGKVSLQTLRIIQQQLKDQLTEVKSGACSSRYALTFLRSFEQGMTERSVEKVLETDEPRCQNLMSVFSEGFSMHNSCLQELEKKIFKTTDIFDSL